MKLLFDQNLSPRLSHLLADIYPASVHVREVDGFALVSKDSDFQQRSLLVGAPPKFIWLRVGNCTVATTEILLRRHSAAIHIFDLDNTKSHLILP